jgi:hypothetical protein
MKFRRTFAPALLLAASILFGRVPSAQGPAA